MPARWLVVLTVEATEVVAVEAVRLKVKMVAAQLLPVPSMLHQVVAMLRPHSAVLRKILVRLPRVLHSCAGHSLCRR